MKSLIITGGQGPGIDILEKLSIEADFIIVADSGLDSIQGSKIEPHCIVGDFDSIRDLDLLKKYDKADIVKYSRQKDETDTELALNICSKRGSGHICIAGGGGGRLDHFIGILYLFTRAIRPDDWFTATELFFFVKPDTKSFFHVGIESLVSVFPLMSESCDMKSEGLAWPLDGLRWQKGYYGISNIAIKSEITIRAGPSALLVALSPGSERIG